MKKFFPAIAILLVFIGIMVSQLLINGQELSASQTEESKSLYVLFENQFSTLSDELDTGEKIELKSVKEPIVIINFWASWCKPCVAEFKTLNALIEKFPGKVKVLGINNDADNPKKVAAKVKAEYELKFDSILDAEGRYADKFKIISIPASIIYHKGKVIKFVKKEFDFMSEEFISLIENKIE